MNRITCSSNDSHASKRKILFLLEAFDKGGIEKVTLDIVNHLDPNKYDITIQTFWYGGYCQSRVNSNIRVLPFFFRHYVRGIIRLIEILPPKLLHTLFIRGNYDVEIAASDGGAAKVVSGCTNPKTKKICWVHMDVVSRGSQLKEYQSAESAEKIYRKFDRIVCVSSACKEKFIEKFGEYRIDVAYNPLPTQEIISASIEPCPTLNWSPTALHFVCIGRLVPQKGFDRLIDACCRLKNLKYSGFLITIRGEGPERTILERKIIENEEYAFNLFNEVLTDMITSTINPQIDKNIQSGYYLYYDLLYPYINLFGKDAIDAYFYGYDNIYKQIEKEEFEFFVILIENFGEESSDVYYNNLMYKWNAKKVLKK